MNVKYKLNLDVYKDRNYESIIVAQNDDKSRIIECKLYADSQPVALSSSVTAAFNATVDNVIVAENVPCIVADNAVKITLAKSMLQLAGMMKCELVLSENDTILTTQHFSVYVNKSVINSKSKYEPNGGALATKDDINTAIEKVKDEVLTNTYNKTYLDKVLLRKLDKMPFDTVPTVNSPNYVTSGTLYNSVNTLNQSIAKKYDSSNIEIGTGELSPAQAIYEGCAGRFDYVKNGNVATVSVNITKLIANRTYIQLSGLPFPIKDESSLSSIAVFSTTSKLRNIRIKGSWVYITSPTDKFTEDEMINFTVTYIRK